MGFCLLQWVFLAAIRTSFSGLNISVHLRETQMVYPNPRFWESKTLQLTQPRALGRAFKMQTSFAPLLCCLPHYFVAKTPLISYPWKHMGDLMQGTSVTISFPEWWQEDGHWCWKLQWRPVAILQPRPETTLSVLLFPGRMTQQQQAFIKPGSTLFPGPGTITPRQLC